MCGYYNATLTFCQAVIYNPKCFMPERSHNTQAWKEITEQTAPVWDPALGAGKRLPLTPELTVDVFESADLTRVATPDIRVELFGPARPHLAGERIVYEHTGTTGSLHLGLDPDGTLTLKRSHHLPPNRCRATRRSMSPLPHRLRSRSPSSPRPVHRPRHHRSPVPSRRRKRRQNGSS